MRHNWHEIFKNATDAELIEKYGFLNYYDENKNLEFIMGIKGSYCYMREKKPGVYERLKSPCTKRV